MTKKIFILLLIVGSFSANCQILEKKVSNTGLDSELIKIKTHVNSNQGTYSNSKSSPSGFISVKLFPEGLITPSGELSKVQDGIGPVFEGDICDVITIELREEQSPFNIAFSITDCPLHTDGTSGFSVPPTLSGNYYIVIIHRNSLATWSANPITISGSSVSYDFSDDISKAYGNNLKLLSGKYCLLSGDVNQDGIVDALDMIDIDNLASSFSTGYFPEDINGDGSVNADDISFTMNNAFYFDKSISPSPSDPAIVNTSSISEIAQTTAVCGGNVTVQGSSPVISRGVCWKLNETPTIDDSHTSDGIGIGSFTSNITGLIPEMPYFVRAYATNSSGTSYGDLMYFATLPEIPSLTTVPITNVYETTAQSGGNFLSQSSISEKGVCWSTSPNPTIEDSHTQNGFGNWSFVSTMSGLIPGNTYYVRAYATNSAGTSYGNEVTFNNTHYLGQSYGGGFVFYIDETWQHGLIVNPSDLGFAYWGCVDQFLGVTATAIGTGQANTTIISTYCGYNSAAGICNAYVLDGYDDWFLPSLDELTLTGFLNGVIGNFNPSYVYWSSSESGATIVNVYNFWQGYPVGGWPKDYYYGNVRAIRAF